MLDGLLGRTVFDPFPRFHWISYYEVRVLCSSFMFSLYLSKSHAYLLVVSNFEDVRTRRLSVQKKSAAVSRELGFWILLATELF